MSVAASSPSADDLAADDLAVQIPRQACAA
jgi:hypothetical protein